MTGWVPENTRARHGHPAREIIAPFLRECAAPSSVFSVASSILVEGKRRGGDQQFGRSHWRRAATRHIKDDIVPERRRRHSSGHAGRSAHDLA
jgi:hypothetical protein